MLVQIKYKIDLKISTDYSSEHVYLSDHTSVQRNTTFPNPHIAQGREGRGEREREREREQGNYFDLPKFVDESITEFTFPNVDQKNMRIPKGLPVLQFSSFFNRL